MEPEVPAYLRQRFLDAFIAAWPERDIAMEVIERTVALYFKHHDGERWFVVRHVSGESWTTIDKDESLETLEALVDATARNAAENAEGDRWSSGAWRDWSP